MTPERDQRYLDSKSAGYQEAVPSTARRMALSMRRAVSRTKEGVEDILGRIGYRGGKEAEAMMRMPAPPEVTQRLIEEMDALPQQDRERLTRRLVADVTSGRLDAKTAVAYTIETERVRLASRLGSDMSPALNDTAVEAYSHSMFAAQKSVGLGFSLGRPPEKLVSFLGGSVLSRTALLYQADSVMRPLREVIMKGLASGRTAEQMAVEMRSVSGTSVYKAKAMIRTAITETSNEMERRTSMDLGLERYEYVATLDERTCPVCGRLDGRTFDLEKAESGVNFPPMHKNCRCVTVAVLSETAKKDMTRRARDAEGVSTTVPASMSYAEWRAKFVER